VKGLDLDLTFMPKAGLRGERLRDCNSKNRTNIFAPKFFSQKFFAPKLLRQNWWFSQNWIIL
jgi:hypothetical protein